MKILFGPVSTMTGIELDRSVRLGAFLLVLISALAIFLTGRMPISAFVLMISTLAAWTINKKPRSLFWEVASFCYLVFFFFDLFGLSGALAPALVHLFIFIMVNKIFNLYGPRDYHHLYLLTFLTILAASSLSVETEMFYVILFYIIFLIWNIVSLTLFIEWKREEHGRNFPFHLFSGRYCTLIFITGMIAFLIAIGIFFILPRMQLGYFSAWNAGKVQHVSGFSQKVALGDIGNIQEDAGLAMRVRVTQLYGFTNDRFYWRGVAFDHYDGRSWSNKVSGSRFLFQDSEGFFYNYPDRRTSDALIKQEFYIEPLDTRVIFGADRIVKLKGEFHGVTKDGNSGLTAMSRTQSYEVYSRIPRFSRETLRKWQTEPSENIKKAYLQLPYRSQEIDALAQSITLNRSANIDKIFDIKEYLEKNYSYTTSNLPQDAQDPISSFLFKNKAGHCEYFATAMVLLLRHLDIPSRIVNGFLQGEYNEIGGFYAVRNSEAHSWVEVYVGGMWIPFDPSPRPATGAGESLSALLSLRKIFDSVGFFWDRYVLIFSAQDQIDALTAARDQYRKVREQFKSTNFVPDQLFARLNGFVFRNFRNFAAYLLGFLGFTLLVIRFHRRRHREKVNTTPILFYQEMLTILCKKGFMKRPQITPKEFVTDISDKLSPSSKSDVFFLTDLFYKSRFGQYALSPSDADSVDAALIRLRM